MAFWDNWITNIYDRIADGVASRVLTQSGQVVAQARAFRLGRQPKQLKVKPNHYDDNLILNFTGLIADRNVSQLVGSGIEFTFEEQAGGLEMAGDQDLPTAQAGEDPRKAYVEAVWDANRKEILLHRCALAACEAGTGYLLLSDPRLGMGGMAGEDGVVYPRLLMLDPAFMTMETLPEDFEMVIRYTMQYKFVGVDGKEALRRKIIEQDGETGRWVIVDYEQSYATGGQWIETARLDWPHPFSPVVHWQNLPTIDSPYGEPDITEDLIEVQNKLNGDISFLSKALRLGVHPMRWGRNLSTLKAVDTAPDKIIDVGAEGEINQLLPGVDWPGSEAFFKLIRAAMFDISRTVDIDSLQDRLGALTNFALRVIYADNLSKIHTKQQIFGDALEEINRRLQMMAGFDPLDTEVVWQDFLPQNPAEQMAYYQALQAMGIVSKETVADKLGLEWELEVERLGGERQQSENLGQFLLSQFNQGGGASMPNLNPANRFPPEEGGL